MSRGKSIGTIRYSFSPGDGEVAEKVIFIPTEDYSVKYNGKDYAIFISDDNGSEPDDIHGQLKIYQPEKHIGIDVHVLSDLVPDTSVILQAAKDQARVEIEVETDSTIGLKLVGLTIPAK